ncbi:MULTISPECIES: isoprenyl transferase [Methylococcus]|jgi:undecaprenyl diphosphate synthase|uniref:Ditrans,polycis-undecaprenyl-diphosphate synthase ((2E,6E)-farnesyl-diphosphate specific) n=2 Tax=Methylococcus capsulatus TaxID=414 RepID=A0AA35UCM6_METCP|nr:isoprenyl transferase [Methylococcus capsulatus]CAI8758248.1 ditrans,polycis-undecaprenyl-diphosphate synthase [(2E,6E)-farnesyl-diphosphate specific] [Methylococcus capsulatus]
MVFSPDNVKPVASAPEDGARMRRIPRHVAIVMDGNGRWAQERYLPRTAGHRAGVGAVRKVVEHCAKRGVEALTLFAFSSENWRRPEQEVSVLMELFLSTLERETEKLHQNGVRLRIIGDRAAFGEALRERMDAAESLTRSNTGLQLAIAANYGGRWDIVQAAQTLAEKVRRGELSPEQITADRLQQQLALADLPEPDLFIRTGGERRISNFLLWQLAYTELYFTPVLWPEFDEGALDLAFEDYAGRQRRFGFTGDQVAGRMP